MHLFAQRTLPTCSGDGFERTVGLMSYHLLIWINGRGRPCPGRIGSGGDTGMLIGIFGLPTLSDNDPIRSACRPQLRVPHEVNVVMRSSWSRFWLQASFVAATRQTQKLLSAALNAR